MSEVRWFLRTDVIDQERILRGMTRLALARAARIDPKTLRDALSGRRRPTLLTIQRMAQVVGLRLPEVIQFEDSAN
jgi:transcriptional regulator with XRE-family HTH domain